MIGRFQDLTIFVRAAETGSFSKVARECRISQPSVSRTVADLERQLGAKLLLRTTRRITPTDAGAVFLERARRILSDLDEAAHAARGVDSLNGVLRVVMSGVFGTREVIPRLPAFLARHPRLKLELLISDRIDDLVAEGADIAVRLGRLQDSEFGSRLLASSPRLVVASPNYLAARGTPKAPADLSQHDCILGPSVSGPHDWTFRRQASVIRVAPRGQVQVTAGAGLIACVRAGLGIAVVSRWMCRAELESGEVRAILTNYTLDPVEVHAVYPAGRKPSAKVRAFSDYLAATLGDDATFQSGQGKGPNRASF